jgi:arsenate reductase
MKFEIYHNPRCTKSRETLALLEEAGVDFEIVLYLENGPDAARLEELSNLLGLRPIEFTRVSEPEFKEWFKELDGEVHEAGVEGKMELENIGDELVYALLAEQPKLIERPIVVAYEDGSGEHGRGDALGAVIGRPPETVKVLFED